ncbi:splicing factor U2AF 50 kDa subunit isoform X2 [Scaptodrosophila lebanonensis]|uniref:Splicing factor U2AF subunit n=1 Tax=Drosophila lebanonensis TaxID=7225 RepID=A0A6J2UJT2_DROLE|nr:splicing factor U2AF 50 kDa subunit isoform X2 [Scaptodrosophila lebanonensis]
MGRRGNNRRFRPPHKNRTRSRSRSRARTRTRSRSRSCSPHRFISSRRCGRTLWDVAPPGYDHLTPLQYKAMQASGQISSRIVPDAPPTADTAAIATVTRQARRLYVGNIPFGVTEQEMIAFFNQQILALGLGHEGNGGSVLTCQTNLEKNFAFLEFRSMEEATLAMSFDGIQFRGQILKIRRPHDYHPVASVSNVATTTVPTPVDPNGISTVVPDSPHKIYVGGLPTCLNEQQIKELLLSFGQLRGFNLVKDSITGMSKGFGFFEYVDPNITEQAIVGLNGMQLGDRKLVVQRSIAGGRNGQTGQVPVLQVPGFPAVITSGTPTEVLCLLNMVLPEELLDDEEYEDIRTDIKQECTKYGKVRSLKIPRPNGNADADRGCGKVFVQFETVEDCQKSLTALSGRKFSGRIVVTSFYSLQKYQRDEFH